MNNSRIKIETGNRQALIPSINNTNISNNKTIINPPETVIARNEESEMTKQSQKSHIAPKWRGLGSTVNHFSHLTSLE